MRNYCFDWRSVFAPKQTQRDVVLARIRKQKAASTKRSFLDIQKEIDALFKEAWRAIEAFKASGKKDYSALAVANSCDAKIKVLMREQNA